MKHLRLFLILLLFAPLFVCASSDYDDCYQEATNLREQGEKLFAQPFMHDLNQTINFLEQAISYYQQAYNIYSNLFEHQHSKGKKNECREGKQFCVARIQQATTRINRLRYTQHFQEKLRQRDNLVGRAHEEISIANGKIILNNRKLSAEERIIHLQEAIKFIQQASEIAQEILNEIVQINDQEYRNAQEKFQIELKNVMTSDLQVISQLEEQIAELNTFLEIAQQGNQVFRDSIKEGEIAFNKENAFKGNLKNIQQVLDSFEEAAQLYEKAAAGCRKALAIFQSISLSEKDKEQIEKQAAEYDQSVIRARKAAVEWPEKTRIQKDALKERLRQLKEEQSSLEAQGITSNYWDIEKLKVSLLENLVELGEGDPEELESLKKRIETFEENKTANDKENSVLSSETFFQEEKSEEICFLNISLRLKWKKTRPFKSIWILCKISCLLMCF